MRLTSQFTQNRRRRIAARAQATPARPPERPYEMVRLGRSTPAETDTAPLSDERRNFQRVATKEEIIVRRIGGFNVEVPLIDVSCHGCRVELIEPCETHDAIIARLPQLEPLGSRVRWTHGTTAGIEFDAKIHPAVFDHLVARLMPAHPATA